MATNIGEVLGHEKNDDEHLPSPAIIGGMIVRNFPFFLRGEAVEMPPHAFPQFPRAVNIYFAITSARSWSDLRELLHWRFSAALSATHTCAISSQSIAMMKEELERRVYKALKGDLSDSFSPKTHARADAASDDSVLDVDLLVGEIGANFLINRQEE